MILCFDIGGTAIKVADAFSVADIRPRGRVPTPKDDFAAFIAALQVAISDAPEPPAALAFSIAGVIERETGRATVANIPCLTGRHLQVELEAAFALPVVIANDADCFALAEAALGAGRGHDVVFGIILGTGIGGGLVVRGELINAHGGFAGEWGHGPVAQRLIGETVLPAVPCGCGQTGCLETLCSARGLERLHATLHDGAALRAEEIVAGWARGDAAAQRSIAIWLELISGPLAMVQNLLGADVIVAGGGLSNARALMIALDRALRARILRDPGRPLIVEAGCPVEPGLVLESGLVGAAVLGFQRAGRG